jgi:two-component system response regulator CpxR
VLDVMLPGQNGFDVLRALRRSSRVPVLMLTARGEDVDRIVGLELGADDYLPKPFNPRELVARIRAVLRRLEDAPAAPQPVRVGAVTLDPATHVVAVAGAPVSLTTAEFAILEILLRRAGHVVTRQTLCEDALERPFSPLDRSIDVHVSNLRKKLSGALVAHAATDLAPGTQGGERPDPIRTVRGTGYLYAVSR